jgi:hypothetical protein
LKRRRCSARLTLNQNLIRCTPLRHQVPLELGRLAHEFLVFLGVGAKAHHALDAGAVVPAAVEQHDLAVGGQVLHVALEVPLAALGFVGFSSATTRAPRGLRCSMKRLMVPPLPAASRPRTGSPRAGRFP